MKNLITTYPEQLIGQQLLARYTGNLTHRQLEGCLIKLSDALSPLAYLTRADASLVAGGSARVSAGWPDTLCAFKGRFLGLEVKAGRDKMRSGQLQVQASILEMGGGYRIIRSIEEILAVFAEYRELPALTGWGYVSQNPENGTEDEIQSRIITYLASNGYLFTETNAERVNNRPTRVRPGWPDITGVVNGQMVVIEVKARNGKLSTPQAATMNALKASGCGAILARSVEDVKSGLVLAAK